MSTVPPPPIEPGSEAAPPRRGCWKGALLGCGGAAVLCVVALVGVGLWVQKKPAAVTDFLMDNVRGRYASDVTEAEKADLEAAYGDFRRALEARRVRQEDLERVRRGARLGAEVGRDDVRELTRIFREAAGGATREEPAEITPLPEVTPVP